MIVLILLTAACFRIDPIYFADDKNLAEKKIEYFHELYNDQKFDEMYDLLSVQTKRVLTFDNFSQAYGDVRRNFGKVRKSTRIEEGVKVEAAYRVVRLVFETEFEKARVREEFVCHVTKENAVIYFMEKPEVIR
ncbi:MAG: hypothetical protein IPN69_18750 [Acidobacteria bacterium]|nr:hypothetical protein [Acidobacteriota bacterium]